MTQPVDRMDTMNLAGIADRKASSVITPSLSPLVAMQRCRRMAVLVVVGCGLTSLSGCFYGEQPPLGRVTGYVKAEGAPVHGVMVIFEPEGGRESVAKTDAKGWYDLQYTTARKGAELGHHIVRIEGLTGENAPPGSPQVPSKFNSKSELTADVSKGSNDINFDIEVRAGKSGGEANQE